MEQNMFRPPFESLLHQGNITTVVNLSKTVSYDIKIDRTTMFGNLYSHNCRSSAITLVRDRLTAIKYFYEWLFRLRDINVQQDRRRKIWVNLHTIVGKKVGCHCVPELCHGFILVNVAELLWIPRRN